jgi:hypothetical protein
MSTGVATAGGEQRAPRVVLIAVLVAAVAFGAAFAIASLTKSDSGGTEAPQATPTEPSTASPEVPAAPPSATLPPLEKPPASEGGGSAAPAPSAPAPAPSPAPPGGGGGGGGGSGGTIIEG